MVTLETPVKVTEAEPHADLDNTEVARLFYRRIHTADS